MERAYLDPSGHSRGRRLWGCTAGLQYCMTCIASTGCDDLERRIECCSKRCWRMVSPDSARGRCISRWSLLDLAGLWVLHRSPQLENRMADIVQFPVHEHQEDEMSPLDIADTNNVLEAGEHVWQCNCGSHLFFLTKVGTKCSKCGIYCVDWVDG